MAVRLRGVNGEIPALMNGISNPCLEAGRDETETGRNLGELIKMAQQEDIDSTLLADLEAFKPRLTVDYRQAIARNRQEVEKMLGSEIVKRYYYHRGHYAYVLRFDEQLKQAIQAFK